MGRRVPRASQSRVTIAMPVRNAAATLDAAVLSVLAQSYQNWTLMVIDDGSTDATAEVMGRYPDERIRYVADGRHLGLSARLNQIIDDVDGDYLARMDADDVAYPERLEKQVEFLHRNPDIDLVGGSALLFRGDGSIEGVLDVEPLHDDLQARLWQGFRIPHPSWMGRTAWFRNHHYDSSMKRAQDQELLLRAVGSSRYAGIPEVLIGYRQACASLPKRLAGRAYLTRALIIHARRVHDYVRIPRIIAEQVAKSGFDILMALPAANRVIRHPAGRPATSEERARWNEVARGVGLQRRIS